MKSDQRSFDVTAAPWEGEAVPPMANGELVFDAPWEGRAFGMAYTLATRGLFEWDDFRRHLIDEIAAWESAHPGEEYRYYERFLAALEHTLADRGIVAAGELGARAETFAARPHGHDH